MQADLSRVSRERDLYWQLLELGLKDAPEAFLEHALSLFIDLAHARRGYIELRDSSSNSDAPTFSLLRGLDDKALSADGFSRAVIAETLATAEVVVTASAISDPRFQDRGSVQAQRLEAVLCAPIGTSPVLGVVYLQDRLEPGPFSAEDRKRAEMFGRHVASFAERLLASCREVAQKDPTRPFRGQLKVDALIGSSPAMAALLQQVALVAPLKVGVLITGESGTGKTQLARAIHDNSPRSACPFVELNCATLPEALAESELFGSAAGGHSTAHRKIAGKVAAAEGGTLFLDEVGELPGLAQAKLLQLLQSGTYYPLGDSTARQANVRVLAATNTNLAAAVAAKRFREDLYYRLNVFPLRVPLLAERRDDVAALAQHFCRITHETNGLPALELSTGALLALGYADWPGNIRELAHVVEAGAIRAHGQGATRVERSHLFPAETLERDSPPIAPTFHDATRRFQRALLCETLERENWNVAAAARTLDLTRAHVYNLMATLSIDRPLEGQKNASTSAAARMPA